MGPFHLAVLNSGFDSESLLHFYGLDTTSLTWFQSYLSDRRPLVSMGDKSSILLLYYYLFRMVYLRAQLLALCCLSCSLTTFCYKLVLILS